MLTRRTPMKSTGFKPRAPRHEPRDPDRVRRAPTVAPDSFRAPNPVASTPAAQVEKAAPVRSEAYRRAVASLPCIHCGIEGYSQCAHANTGKGTGTKSSDTESFPLCACQPGRRGCHSLFDQGALFSKEARRAKEAEWVAKTRLQILSSGLWPARLPVPNN